MAAGKRLSLLSSQVLAADATTLGDAIGLGADSEELIAVCEVSSRTDGTFTMTLQHSPDGVNWVDLKAASAQSADGIELAIVDTSALHNVRAKLVAASTTSGATIQCYLMFSEK